MLERRGATEYEALESITMGGSLSQEEIWIRDPRVFLCKQIKSSVITEKKDKKDKKEITSVKESKVINTY